MGVQAEEADMYHAGGSPVTPGAISNERGLCAQQVLKRTYLYV